MGRGKMLFAVQALRAFAASSVVLHHFLVEAVQKAGYRDSLFDMIVSKVAFIRSVALAVILASAAWQPTRRGGCNTARQQQRELRAFDISGPH